MTSQGLVSNIETTMTIEQVSIAAQGTVAVLMGDQSNSYLVVYDKNGKEQINTPRQLKHSPDKGTTRWGVR